MTVTDEGVADEHVISLKHGKEDTYSYGVGEQINYTVTVKNIYDKPMSISLTGDPLTPSLAESSFADVPAGETVTTTATYKVTTNDVAEGKYNYSVTAAFTEGKSWSAGTEVNVKAKAGHAKITITETSVPKYPDSGKYLPGEEVKYTVTVENDRETDLTNLVISDELTGEKWTIESLAAGSHSDKTITYTVTEDDATAGKIVHKVTGDGGVEFFIDPAVLETLTREALTVTVENIEVYYDGQPHSFSESDFIVKADETDISPVTIRFKEKPEEEYTLEACPQYTDAGEYTVYYEVSAENYNPVEGTATIIIKKRQAILTIPDLTYTYGDDYERDQDLDGCADLSIYKEMIKPQTQLTGVIESDELDYEIEIQNQRGTPYTGVPVYDGWGLPAHRDPYRISAKLKTDNPNYELVISGSGGNEYGSLQIKPITAFIFACGQSKYYDGKPIELYDEWVTQTMQGYGYYFDMDICNDYHPRSFPYGILPNLWYAYLDNPNTGGYYGQVNPGRWELALKDVEFVCWRDGRMIPVGYDQNYSVDDIYSTGSVHYNSHLNFRNRYWGPGVWEILPLPVEVEVIGHDETVYYNGEEQSAEGYSIAITSIQHADWLIGYAVDYRQSPEDHYGTGLGDLYEHAMTFVLASISTSVANGTDSGTYPMELDELGEDGTYYKHFDFRLNNSMADRFNAPYKITVKNVTDGSLTIKPRTVEMESGSGEKVYDGEPLTVKVVTSTPYAAADPDDGKGFVPGEGADYDITGSQTYVGSSDNTFTYTLQDGTKAENYIISQKLGKLTVTADTDLLLTKTAEDKVYYAGDLVTFTITATNISDEVKTISMTEQPGVVFPGQCVFPDVKPGESVTTTAVYTITQADVEKEDFTNTVTAVMTGGSTHDVTKEADKTVKTGEFKPAIKVEKSASITEGAKVGDVVTYTVKVTNTGSVPLTDVTLVDTLVTLSEAPFDLAVGESKTVTYNYTVTQADVNSGQIDNTVTATGKDPKGGTVTDQDDETVKTQEQKPAIQVEKTASKTEGARAGEVITYTVKVTNTGNTPLTNVVLTDTLVTLTEAPFDLAVGESKTVTYTYTITLADVNNGQIDNTVTATGKDPKGNDVTDTDDETVTTIDPRPSLVIVKSANRTSGVRVGETVTFTIVVRNNGNVPLHDADLSDMLNGDAIELMVPPFSLAVGESRMFTYNYTATAADVARGSIVNVAGVTAKDPDENPVTPEPSRVTVTTIYDPPTPPTPPTPPVPPVVPVPPVPVVPGIPQNPNDGLIIIDDFETPLGLGEVYLNLGDCYE